MGITIFFLAIFPAAEAGEESAGAFTSPKAKEAQKTYLKTKERLKAEYDAKIKKAQAEYLKSLEAALKDAKRPGKDEEAKQISKTIEELKKEIGAGGEAPRATQKPEKGPRGVSFIGGSGESIEQAVVIKGAKDSPGAVDAEGHWLKVHLPKFTKTGQALLGEKGKKFDEITLRSADGAVKKVYFDITECFGFPE